MNINVYYDDVIREFVAFDEDSYDGAPDGNNALGRGETAQEAVDHLMEQLLYN